jgi:2-oxoglutarate dehydrogenase E1 component
MTVPATTVFNDGYITELYESYRRDPASVDESWRQYFRTAERLAGGGAPGGGGVDSSLLKAAAGAAGLIAAIRRHGHLAVATDPLGTTPPGARELTPEHHGITEADLGAIPGSAVGLPAFATASDAVKHLRGVYCGAMGLECAHVNGAERTWFREELESGKATAPLSNEEKTQLLKRLTQVDGLERFLGRAFVSVKRFSIEGVDALVPMLDEAIAGGAHRGARTVVIGMAHRGRLNVLVHVLGKTYRRLMEQFDGQHGPQVPGDSGDVKYHMGARTTRDVAGVGPVAIELVPNPSHLEFVNPVMMGVARAGQRIHADGVPTNERDESRVLPILVHGDASFPGEGVVTETLNLALLRGYRVGGTLHIISNNQVGFTTDPTDARSTRYASDVAKGFDIPIVHVNGDDAQACIQAVRLGIAYRAAFGKDFLIDVVGYRRHGHNEADQPGFTQPKLYEAIAAHPTPRAVWGARLVREGVLTADAVAAEDSAFAQSMQSTYEAMKKETAAGHHDAVAESAPATSAAAPETAVKAERLVALNEQLLTWPNTFKLHPTIQRTLPRRREAISNAGIDWGHAEALAFASLLTDGVGVRITGQDVERGTFSHRQAVLHDTVTGQTYTPLAQLPGLRAPFEIFNSPLAETAVMGFEYGFSTATPDLVLWEAQFGDFANTAQPIIDQFLAADRAKWGQDSRLVLLLPHGYEGQGPEHSSARLERFLQLFAEGNMSVAYPSSPAQYFHILRRQALRSAKRPLVLMQPKSLLRLPAAASAIDQLATGAFRPVIDDPFTSQARDQVRRLVFCTGKIYYDLTEGERPPTVAIIRVEELAPWPREIGDLVDTYPNVEDVVWAQEEPKNMGAWTYVQPRLRASIGTLPTLKYVGRPDRASPAEGFTDWHLAEQKRIVGDALTVGAAAQSRKKAAANR